MPTELVAATITVRSDPGAQLFRFGDQLLPRQFFNIFVHCTSATLLDHNDANCPPLDPHIESMTSFIALLRAVNVGGTGKLPMTDLKTMCEAAGFNSVRTYIASGNVIFESRLDETAVRMALEKRLLAYAGKPVAVMVRTADEMAEVLAKNPFPHAPGNRTMAIFLDAAPPKDALDSLSGRVDEDVGLGRREIYVLYGENMARSKLKIPAAKSGTARNMNTVAKLASMAGAHSKPL
jgi:uncharacterized protein (DUF1697 family)